MKGSGEEDAGVGDQDLGVVEVCAGLDDDVVGKGCGDVPGEFQGLRVAVEKDFASTRGGLVVRREGGCGDEEAREAADGLVVEGSGGAWSDEI